jgi:alpha-1,3-glucan synthase
MFLLLIRFVIIALNKMNKWYPVESSATAHMLSQLTKTIKMALKSTEEERAILRARSAVQRFPVVEWRQRMEDFHKRSINTSRGLAGHDAWREADCIGGGVGAIVDTGDWSPAVQPNPSQPDWDRDSFVDSYSRFNSPPASPITPGTPGQWSQETLTPSADPFLAAPRFTHGSDRGSTASDDDYFSATRGSSDVTRAGFGNFLEKANRVIAREQKHAPDPFLNVAPSKPFGSHSRASSVESISSIVDEKSNSPLNKAIASVSPSLQGVCAILIHCNITVYRC